MKWDPTDPLHDEFDKGHDVELEMERDDLQREYDELARTICPHCKEPLGNRESSGSDPGKPEWHHLICLKDTVERVAEAEHLLHRLSRGELAMIASLAVRLIDDPKWSKP